MPLRSFRGVDALEPPVAGVEQERAHVVEVGRVVVAVLDDPGAVGALAPCVRPHVGGEQRLGRLVVDPARGDQADRRLVDHDRAALRADLELLLARERGDVERVERVRPASEPAPKSNQNAASGLPVKHSLTLKWSVNGSMFWIDMNSLSRSGRSDSGSVRGISDSICARSAGLMPAEAGVDQPGGVGLREQIAVGDRIAGGARRIGARPGRRAAWCSARRRACRRQARGCCRSWFDRARSNPSQALSAVMARECRAIQYSTAKPS